MLEDPRSRSYFVFWSDPGGKLVRALLMAPSDEELPEHRRVRRIGEKDSDERRQNHDDSRCRSRVDDDRIQNGLPALGPGTDPASLPLTEMPKQIVASARMLEAPRNGKPRANASNGER